MKQLIRLKTALPLSAGCAHARSSLSNREHFYANKECPNEGELCS